MDHRSVVEEALLETQDGGPHEELDNEEDEFDNGRIEFSDSEDNVSDGDFQYDSNAPERVSIGLNCDPVVEEEHANVVGEGDSDWSLDPLSEELNTDDSSGKEDNTRFPVFNEEREMWDPQFEVGKTFRDVAQFRKAIKHHGVATRCNLRLKTNDDKRAQAVCKSGCKWRIWASENKKLNCIQVKTYHPIHNCIRDGTNRHCTAKYVAERYLETFRVDPEWKIKLIRKRVRDDLKTNITRQTAWRARILIEGTNDHQFGLLWSFAEELLRTNPGSTCRIAVHESKFQGIYICLDACKKGFVAGCRQLIGLDGCFLKGTFGGQMLVAVALDANDCIYPIAFAIVERENTSTWRWFMRHLGGDLNIVNCNEWTFMSDRQKGLQNVIEEMYPDAEHRFCVRHMYTNFFSRDFKASTLKEILWRAAKSTTVADYNFWMQEMQKEAKPAYEWLLDRPAKEWSKSHFLTKVKSDILLNNLCECFNKLLLEDREKSIVTMLIDMHISTMKRIQTRRDKMRRFVGPLCPKIHDKLVKNLDIADGSEVDWSGGAQWYVKSKDGEFVVDLPACSCTCRRWDLIGIPCGHACAAIIEKRDLPVNYVNDFYKVSTYLACYENLVMPLNGKKLWPPVNRAPLNPPRWQVAKRGRRQKKRRLQAEEAVVKLKSGTSKIKRIGSVVMTCSLCGLSGHNKRYHNREDAPREDWSGQPGDQLVDAHSQTVDQPPQSRGKLQPRRYTIVPSATVALDPLIEASQFQFMPTPSTRPSNASQMNDGPIPHALQSANIVEDQGLSFSMDTMVDDLQQMEHEEQARRKAMTARNRRIARSSLPFVAPRNRRPASMS